MILKYTREYVQVACTYSGLNVTGLGTSRFQCPQRSWKQSQLPTLDSPPPLCVPAQVLSEATAEISIFVCFVLFHLAQGSVRRSIRNILFVKLFACSAFDLWSKFLASSAQGILSNISKLMLMRWFLWKVPRHTEGRTSARLQPLGGEIAEGQVGCSWPNVYSSTST